MNESADPAGTPEDEPIVQRVDLDALRGRDPDARDRAMRGLNEMLVGYAARAGAGGRSRREAESVVQSVLVHQLGRLDELVAHCRDDAHLRRYLLLAVANKMRDDAARRRPDELPRDAEGRTAVQPAAQGPGPATHVQLDEQGRADATAAARFLASLRAARLTHAQRELVELYAIHGLPHAAIAAALGMSEGACKVAMSRARSAALPAVFEPLRPMLDAESWAVARSCFVLRQSPAQAAALLDVDEDAVERICRERVVPAIAAHFGRDAIGPIMRLAGLARR